MTEYKRCLEIFLGHIWQKHFNLKISMNFLGKTICCPNHRRKTCLYVPRKGQRMLQRIQTPLFGLWHRSGTMWIRVEWWLQSTIFILLNFKTDPFLGRHVGHNKMRKSVNIHSFPPGERNGHSRDWVFHDGQQLNVTQMKVVLVAEPEQELRSISEKELIAIVAPNTGYRNVQ